MFVWLFVEVRYDLGEYVVFIECCCDFIRVGIVY